MNRDLGIIITHINNSDWFDNIFLELKNMIKDNPYKHICIFNSFITFWLREYPCREEKYSRNN